MFRELEFQNEVFKAIDRYLDVLARHKAKADIWVERLREGMGSDGIDVRDFTEETFKELKSADRLPRSRANMPFSAHEDGCGNPVPNITLKVPTGGGKTWLAVQSASKILNKYLKRNTGFILWIVPNEAIYSQTCKSFKDRTHPYRLALDMAAAGRVKILTKTDELDAEDVNANLCVMVLMLQSANRQTKESLKMFRERGDVSGFTPEEGEQGEHEKLFKAVPNLDAYKDFLPQVKASLGNALRMIRPIVVMDEGHRATSELAYKTLYDFNPSFVLELTATPKDVQPRRGKNPREGRYANLLVEITGQQLDAEGMIKMPLTLAPRGSNNWHDTLNAAVDKLKGLQNQATQYQANTDRYIRPILLIQVERTGKDQRGGNYIHAEDAREWLLQTGFDDAEIAIKTADQNDLKNPENQDLLSPRNRIRVIITKVALQEGWDCPFAYILCSLAPSGNLNAMTQLVGRILRQPHAEKAKEEEALNQCYVFTHQPRTEKLVGEIKKGLEKDGLSDLVIQVTTEDTTRPVLGTHPIARREGFAKTEIYLPKVLAMRDGKMGTLDYETDILCKTDWSKFDPSPIAELIGGRKKSTQLQKHLEVGFAKEGGFTEHEITTSLPEQTHFDPIQAVRQISDLVLNPFVAREIVGKLMAALEAKKFDEKTMGKQFSLIVMALRRELEAEQDEQAKKFFQKAVKNGDIQFRLRADGTNWTMPEVAGMIDNTAAPKFAQNDGKGVQKSLFDPPYCGDANRQEKEVAVYLDGQKTLGWWHRNVARQHYRLQGWRRDFIYPDFIFSVVPDGKTSKLVVLETKGEHLYGNEDSEYKKAVMSCLTENFDLDSTHPVGELELEHKGKKIVCDMILLENWELELQKHFLTDKKPD